MGSLLTKRRYVDVFELEFDEHGGGVKVLNTRSEEVIFEGVLKTSFVS